MCIPDTLYHGNRLCGHTHLYTCDSTWQEVVRLNELKEDKQMLGREEGRRGIDGRRRREGGREGG